VFVAMSSTVRRRPASKKGDALLTTASAPTNRAKPNTPLAYANALFVCVLQDAVYVLGLAASVAAFFLPIFVLLTTIEYEHGWPKNMSWLEAPEEMMEVYEMPFCTVNEMRVAEIYSRMKIDNPQVNPGNIFNCMWPALFIIPGGISIADSIRYSIVMTASWGYFWLLFGCMIPVSISALFYRATGPSQRKVCSVIYFLFHVDAFLLIVSETGVFGRPFMYAVYDVTMKCSDTSNHSLSFLTIAIVCGLKVICFAVGLFVMTFGARLTDSRTRDTGVRTRSCEQTATPEQDQKPSLGEVSDGSVHEDEETEETRDIVLDDFHVLFTGEGQPHKQLIVGSTTSTPAVDDARSPDAVEPDRNRSPSASSRESVGSVEIHAISAEPEDTVASSSVNTNQEVSDT
jgi:hypothetical protein